MEGSKMNLLSLLTLIFIVLKLCGVIAWSWWWVLSPIPLFLLFLGIIFFTWGMMCVMYGVWKYKDWGSPK
jgi:hypothetical protein